MPASDTRTAKNILHEIATHAYTLAMGLQNVAPLEETTSPGSSVQYLLETAIQLQQASQHIDDVFLKK